MPDTPDRPPAAVTHLARERAAARAARDFARADALRAEIEAAGWKVADRPGGGSLLERATPPDILEGPEPRYGAPERVPSRLTDPASAPFTVVALAEEDASALERLLDALRTTVPDRTQVVVVANDPSSTVDRLLADARGAGSDAEWLEIVRTSARLGRAAALNVGIRRAAGEIVVMADGSAIPTGDALSPLASALADPSIAVAGPFGLRSADLRHFEPSDDGQPDVAAIDAGWMAFRRSDAAALGPLDEHFLAPPHLDEWWSLRLRAGDENADVTTAVPRRAVQVDLPISRFEAPSAVAPSPEDGAARARMDKRNAYRLLDAFRGRRDLAVP